MSEQKKEREKERRMEKIENDEGVRESKID
jgi:hypothetical protein